MNMVCEWLRRTRVGNLRMMKIDTVINGTVNSDALRLNGQSLYYYPYVSDHAMSQSDANFYICLFTVEAVLEIVFVLLSLIL